MEHPSGSEPPLAVETRIKRTAFARYSQSACGKASVVETNMNGGMESADAVPPVYFEEISIDDESRANLAHLPPPKRSWILPTKCVVMDCDGPKHVLLHDLDGSLTGNGADASILARAEFMHERRSDSSKYTWYNIPTKMLYDPAPLNDPGDRGYDMSNYSKYSGGVESFTFRRLGAEADADGDGDGDGDARRLASAVESDWRNRMVFYPGDERADFYKGVDGRACEPTEAIMDPACRSRRKTHREVAYANRQPIYGRPGDVEEVKYMGYGTYREGCELNVAWNAWVCTAASLVPMRFVVESLDADHMSRSLTPVALASGGYVDLMNAGQDHQRPKDCGGYGCLRRLMTFHTTVAVNRSYDLTFTGTNPGTLRLALPFGAIAVGVAAVDDEIDGELEGGAAAEASLQDEEMAALASRQQSLLAELGDVEAQSQLGRLLLQSHPDPEGLRESRHGVDALDPHAAEAWTWLRKAADAGDAPARGLFMDRRGDGLKEEL